MRRISLLAVEIQVQSHNVSDLPTGEITMNQIEIQDLLGRAIAGLPITIQCHLISKDRIRFRITHNNGCSVVLGSNRPGLFRYEHNIRQVKNVFGIVIGRCGWPLTAHDGSMPA